MKTRASYCKEWKPKAQPTPQEYHYDAIAGEYHYVSFGPSYHTWDDWKSRPVENPSVFGTYNSVQAAKKDFQRRFPVQDNYYRWGSTGRRLIRNGKPIMCIGNGMLYN